ncbi:MAG TPA: type II secretion system inner membrane protein GspF [Candidatus Limnocylindrales bacterium]|nr:type II secretion system inner membrane protein GspF [Candidatus Limnocylindrales bacterium]
MPSFRYSGVSASGRTVSGTIEADNPRAARARLRETGIFASSMQETAQGQQASALSLQRRVSPSQLARTLRQLATLLRAGVPLDEAVETLRRQRTAPALGQALEAVRVQIREGSTLAAAMARHPSVFPSIYTGMVEAGEASGALDTVLDRVADHAEGQARLRARAMAALMYPAIMTVVGGAIVLFLLAYVVPQVTRVFVEARQELPLPTRLLMGMGSFLASYGLVLFVLVLGGLIGLRYAMTGEAARRRAERILFAIPRLGEMVRDIAVARFAQTLATMVNGGLPLVEALRISRTSSGSLLLSDELAKAETSVSEGASLAACIGASPLFDPLVVDMIAVGERSGELETMLGHAAGAIEEQVKQRIETMAALLEPVMILLMAGVVLFVVLAILLPVFDMNQLVK